jgi:hypothetical protein
LLFIDGRGLGAPSAWAQQAEPAPKPGKPINAGDVLSGELNAMKGSKKEQARPDLPDHQRAAPAAGRRAGCAISKPALRRSSSSPQATPRPRS